MFPARQQQLFSQRALQTPRTCQSLSGKARWLPVRVVAKCNPKSWRKRSTPSRPGWASSRKVCKVDGLKPGRLRSLHGYSPPKLGKGECNSLPYGMHQLQVHVMRRPLLKNIMKMTQLKPHTMKMPRNSLCPHRALPLRHLPHPRRRMRTNSRRCGTTSRF